MVRFIDLDSFGNFIIFHFWHTTLYKYNVCVSLSTEFSKKRLFEIIHLAFLSILFEPDQVSYFVVVLILSKIIRQGLAKGLD